MGSFCVKAVALMVAMGVSVSCHQNQQPDKATVEAIRFALMEEMAQYLDFRNYTTYVVLKKTVYHGYESFEANQAIQALFDEFLKNNSGTNEINQDFGDHFIYLYRDEVKEKVRTGTTQFSWTLFEQNYPGSGGIITFSNLAVNSDGDTALIHYSIIQFGGASGHGSLVLMKKENGRWRFKEDLVGFVV